MSDVERMAFDPLRPALVALDHLLVSAVAAAEMAYGAGSKNDPYRGLNISTQ
jgi:hypothetical protein